MTDEKKVPLTKEAFERLKEKLVFLEGEDRQRIINDIATARAHGDLSENAEYHAAKDEQGHKEAEIRKIRSMLENAEIVSGDGGDDTARPGKLVSIRYEGDDDVETFLLGLREEKGGEFEVLTPDSPVGQALVGHSAGDTVSAQVPAGQLKIEIVEVRAP